MAKVIHVEEDEAEIWFESDGADMRYDILRNEPQQFCEITVLTKWFHIIIQNDFSSQHSNSLK